MPRNYLNLSKFYQIQLLTWWKTNTGTPEGVEPAPNVADLRSRIDSVNYANGASGKSKVKYAYQRPVFLQLFSDDEIQVTADHMVRTEFRLCIYNHFQSWTCILPDHIVTIRHLLAEERIILGTWYTSYLYQ